MTHTVIMSAADLARLTENIVRDVLDGVGQIVQANQSERAVDRRQLAELLNISVPTIDRLVREHAIPSLRVNSRRLFLPSEVKNALRDKAA